MSDFPYQASDHGNTDATERLAALSQPSPQALSRQEHDNITESKLVRKRTQARQRSERTDGGAPRPSLEDGEQVLDVIRRNSVARHPAHGPGPALGPTLPPVAEQPAASPRINQGSGAGPSQGPQPSRQFANQHRYTLVDPGSGSNTAGSSPPPSRTESPGYARPAGRPPGQRAGSAGPGGIPSMPPQAGPQDMDDGPRPAPARSSAKGPTTFAEMGIQGVKLEEKECIIM
jgi:hypothetical protein